MTESRVCGTCGYHIYNYTAQEKECVSPDSYKMAQFTDSNDSSAWEVYDNKNDQGGLIEFGEVEEND